MKSRLSPLDILVTRQRQTQFWFLLFLLAIIGFGWERSRLIAALSHDTRYVIMDETAFYLPRSEDFRSAVDMHTSQMVLALETLFNRNPRSLDNPERLKRLFTKSMVKQVMSEIGDDAKEFSVKQIHQKIEIGDIRLLQTTDQAVIATAKGQLIRNGTFDGEGFTEVHRVSARLRFNRNDDLIMNGGFPTIVVELNTETEPQSH